MREAALALKIRNMLRTRGWWALAMTGVTTTGVPDIYAQHPTLGILWVEVKVGHNILSPRQQYIKAELEATMPPGGRYFIARSTAELEAVLLGIANRE